MDSLTYNYYGGYNRLQRINDGAGGSYTTDLKDQGTGNNYTYDSIGNLKKDVTNGVSNIDWTVYGKIADLTNGSGTITYTYDAAGNRISKLSSGTTSIYVRDAQGNILSIYSWPGSGSATQKEVDLYGSSRLGSVGALRGPPTTVSIGTGYGPAALSTFTRGEKSYELSNHLGNVLTTITDKKIAVPSTTNSSLIDHFTADIATAQDYYPFGMLMPGRTFTASTATNYRYGFNGKENDNEVKGVGNEIDYGARYYDPRAGRFMSVDPLQKQYPWLTPFQYSSNSPISNIDVDGLEGANANVKNSVIATGTTIVTKQVTNELTKQLAEKALENAAENGGKALVREGAKRAAVSSVVATGALTVGFTLLPLQAGPRWTAPKGYHIFGDLLVADEPLPQHKSEPAPGPNTKDDDGDKEKYITIYRGVGETENMSFKDKVAYEYAQAKIAVPKGLIPDPSNINQKIVTSPDIHVGVDNNSIFTSWSFSKTVAEGFARGKNGTGQGVVLEKRVSTKELVESEFSIEHFPDDLEVLLPGVQKADDKYDVKKVK
jgi:RHS repeat-associated protein